MHTPVRDTHLMCCGAVLAAFVATAGAALAASPSTAPRPHVPVLVQHVQIAAPGFSVSDVAGAPGRPIPLKIDIDGVDEHSPGQLFLFTGIPDGVMLNLGGFLGDFWAVNSKIIDKLTLTAPEHFTGSFIVRITQSGSKPGAAVTATFTVTVGPSHARQTAATRTETPPASTAVKRSANEQMLLARAREQFEKGDVSGARVIFEYLALQGSPKAAIAMGETYDPVMLAQLVIKGLEANPERAQLWYQKADELGSAEARVRLKSLAKR